MGWDAQCCESEAWREANSIDRLPRGAKQPFYHVLVDQRDWQFNTYEVCLEGDWWREGDYYL